MAHSDDIALMAHLMRRAGFGARREELEARVEKGYEATVEELLSPDLEDPVDIYDLYRYQPWAWKPGTIYGMGHAAWVYRMLNTNAPLQEKMTVFWHAIFATGVSKVDHWDEIMDMIDAFRDNGLGKFRDIVLSVARNPAMIYWLDNNENLNGRINENWGRELLELFTMGVTNYTEGDVYECSRAFTGWTMTPKLPRFPMGRFDWEFEYRDEIHDHSNKSFLGHVGDLSGEEIVDIVLQQPSTARFIARHLYTFFVADEAQVPAWSVTPPRDPDAIDRLVEKLYSTDYDIGETIRFLLKSDFFKEAQFAKVKSPVDVMIGTLRLVGGSGVPPPGIGNLSPPGCFNGPGTPQPPVSRGLAHRARVGQQWLDNDPYQLLHGHGQRRGPPWHPGDYRRAARERRHVSRRVRRHVSRPSRAARRRCRVKTGTRRSRLGGRPPDMGVERRL
ncbi:MAG: DUF1800 domain-containing protein [Chloroflexi bacterium]|nr:DUF1800 domain-containing protein [Chloroflexota bacterium]